MTKKATTSDEDRSTATTLKYDTESIMAIALRVKAEGFVPRSVLDEEFGPAKTTQAIAVLYRDFRMFREVRRRWTNGTEALGYEWADRRFSKSEVKKIPGELGFLVDLTQAIQPRYSDFQEVSVRCRFTTPILGSVPVKDQNGDPTNCFERDNSRQHALILRYHQRAMAMSALPLIGKQAALGRHIRFSTITLPINGDLSTVEHGIVQAGMSGGKGLRRSERLPDGIEFTMHAMIPTSEIAVDEFLRMIRVAGQHVGLSPGRSAGFGDFEVLSAE
jgi:hypothetical protein